MNAFNPFSSITTPAPEMQPQEYQEEELTCSQRAWKGFLVVAHFVYEIVAKVALFIILGIATLFLLPPVSLPFFAIAATTALTRLVVKIMDAYNVKCLNRLKSSVAEFLNRWSKLQIITMIFGIAVSFITPILGCIVTGLLGIINGLIMGVDISRKQQELNPDDIDESQRANYELSLA